MTYDVVVTREGGDWLADVPSVRGAHTFARSLTSLLTSVREVIVLMDDLPDDAEPDVSLTFEVSDEAVRRAEAVGRERIAIAARERELQVETRKAVRELLLSGYSVRDAAILLAITPGRVSQLTKSSTSVAS